MLKAPDMLRYTPPRRLKAIGLFAACAAGLVVAVGLLVRFESSRAVAAWTDANAAPVVSVINLGANTNPGTLTLPGNAQAFDSAPIYARVSGYLKKWYVDIGTPVKTGQLLAEIDVPDQDQQLAQAKADLGTAIANEKLSAVTAKRWNMLAKLNAVAAQDVDEKNSDLEAKKAAVASARANVERLNDLESFKRITAPFDGIVTSRATDIGALITVGAPNTTPLFTVADTSKVRIYLNVPQDYSAEVEPGMKASFTVPEYPARIFTAVLMANARAVNVQTGTVLMQLQADNSDHRLQAGDYAQVQLNLPARTSAIRLPASALLFRDSGMAAAIVGPDNRVVVKPVTIARDFGTSVEIASGLTRRDRVIDNPQDSIKEGDRVRVAEGPAN